MTNTVTIDLKTYNKLLVNTLMYNIKKEEKSNMNNLIKQIEQWSIDKGLDKGNSFTQFTKTIEEQGEIAAALCRNDIDELRDGIGDVIVTLVILWHNKTI